MTVESAKLTIICEPEVNAKVIINKQDTGKTTPVEFTLVKGEYDIELQPPAGYVVVEWLADSISSKQPYLHLVLYQDTTVTARVATSQQAVVNQLSISLINVIVAIVSLLMMVMLIRELVMSIGGLRG